MLQYYLEPPEPHCALNAVSSTQVGAHPDTNNISECFHQRV